MTKRERLIEFFNYDPRVERLELHGNDIIVVMDDRRVLLPNDVIEAIFKEME